jgi:hypothetical protein
MFWLFGSLTVAQSFENMPCIEYLCNDKHHIKECVNPNVDWIDVYLRRTDSDEWVKDQTFYYTYNEFQILDEINVFDYQDNMFSQKYLYEYYDNQLMMKRSLQFFVNGAWQNNVLYYYTYDEENFLRKLTIKELVSDVMTNTQRHFYRYDPENVPTGFMRQHWIDGKWSNYVLHNYSYNEYMLLSGITETRVSNNEIFRQDFYSYDRNAVLAERLVQVKNDEDIWENTLRVEYVTDRGGMIIKRYNQVWVDGAWVDDVMRVYHYESDRPHKAEICHKGQTLCVSVNAVHAHLAHGDCLGKCKDSEAENTPGNLKSAFSSTFSDSDCDISVYPNPFNEQVFISLAEDHSFSRIELFDYTGKLVRSVDNPGFGEIVLEMGDLPKGIYFLRVSGVETFTTKLLSE